MDARHDPGGRRRARRILRIFPFAVSRGKLERLLRDLALPVRLVDHLNEADVILTVKAQERRQPRRLREAQLRGVRLLVARANTVARLEEALRRELGLPAEPSAPEEALAEVQAAIDAVLGDGRPIELSPQDRHVRRLQHQVVEQAGLGSESKGDEPFRRLVVYPA